METNFTSDTFVNTFDKHRKLLSERYGLGEGETQDAADASSRFRSHDGQDAERDNHGRVQSDNITYTTKEAKGEVTKIIAKLRGGHSAAFTVAIAKWEEILKLQVQIDKMNEEIKQEGVREKISALFGAEYEYVTRVVQTVNLAEIAMSKQPKAATTTKWAEVWKELVGQLTPELVQVGEALIKKHSTEQKPKPPSIDYTPAPVSEGLGSIWTTFLNKVKSWGKSFDRKSDAIKQKIEQL